jgi:hypothetical protein
VQFTFLLGQASQIASDAVGSVDSAAARGVDDVTRVLPVLQALPAGDLILGGGMLVVVALVHGTAMRMISTHVIRRAKTLSLTPSQWRADLLLASIILAMLVTHLVETGMWTTMLVRSHLVADWREAGYFAANTYTTLGYGEVILAAQWKMLAPIMAISGLFTFGWTGSVLVDVVGRVNQLKDLAER